MQFNSKRAAQLVLSVAGICSLSLPFTQTAQAQQIRNLCRSNESSFIIAQTKNFLVSICGSGDSALTYVGLDRKTGKAIRLPLTVDGSKNRGRYFEAVNGEYKYGVSVSGGKNGTLTVRRNNSVILRQALVQELY
ncbi:hypothetical protein DSM106972_013300 [Dulcicalothrix desertica PCC 7102]|uniref:Uncharacterized protein n=1 Tax=Dulcicalothrix desertica PCC 7102 TaxID=232991 RepID=A0A433VQ63_9CYAN|nr:hypothetical protein [Dulcicalothrix desertica]RUT08162.1 hypothetical protein DSM106972_013300 [Dulcicalothrix desertica PCC 7102]TWH40032.1 hypothetical protein CAL7102_09320 [Dulcicalothrix desertica PCC 7102]